MRHYAKILPAQSNAGSAHSPQGYEWRGCRYVKYCQAIVLLAEIKKEKDKSMQLIRTFVIAKHREFKGLFVLWLFKQNNFQVEEWKF